MNHDFLSCNIPGFFMTDSLYIWVTCSMCRMCQALWPYRVLTFILY